MAKIYNLVEIDQETNEPTDVISPVSQVEADLIIAYAKGWNDRMAGRQSNANFDTYALAQRYMDGWNHAGA